MEAERAELDLLLTELQTVRNQVRGQLHLSSEQTRARWEALEKELLQVAGLALHPSSAAVASLKDALVRTRGLSDVVHREVQQR